MRTEAELRRADARSASSPATRRDRHRRGVARLKEHGYLDDAAFAETYARLRQENEKLGQRSVRQELQQKGVLGAIVDETRRRALRRHQ